MDDCVLCRERRGLKISVKSNLSGLGIKESMMPAEAAGHPIFVPNEIVKTTDGYSVFIRQKVSVKQFLASEALDVRLLKCLLKSLCTLNRLCMTENINMNCILFDYDAVYINNLSDNMEFTFLPGLRFSKNENLLKDMLGLILLHVDEPLLSKMSSKDREFINALTLVLQDWDECENKIPADIFEELLGVKKKSVKKVKQKKTKSDKKESVPTRPLIHISKTYFLDDFPNFKKKEISIGRDSKWADFPISHSFVSRRHAIIRSTEEGLSVRDLESLNGTYVDGVKVRPGEDILIKEGQKIQFAYGKNFKVCSKKSISMKSK